MLEVSDLVLLTASHPPKRLLFSPALMQLLRLSGLWALVNNAGIHGPIGPIEWQTDEEFFQVKIRLLNC